MKEPFLHDLEIVRRAFTVPVDPDDLAGIDPNVIQVLAPWIDRLCRAWYRLDVEGMDRVPDGPALLVGNHNAGITSVEMLGMGARWYVERGTGELLNGLGHDAMFRFPLLGNFLVRVGGVRASHENADTLFRRGRKLVVFPGGNMEAFRPFSERNRIRFGGRKGFIRLAVRHGVPIVPMVYAGSHETFYVISDGAGIAKAFQLDRLLRIDTWPLWVGLPWGLVFGPFFHLPLPAKVDIRFLDPIPTDGYPPSSEDNPEVLGSIYRIVRGRMQEALDDMASRRRLPVLG